MRVKTERLYSWYEWHCMYPGKYDDPFGMLAGIVQGCAFSNDGIYPAAAADPMETILELFRVLELPLKKDLK